MPLIVKQMAGKFRVVEKETGKIARNAAGTPVDGGGHPSAAAARRQAAAINISQAQARGAKIPKRKT